MSRLIAGVLAVFLFGQITWAAEGKYSIKVVDKAAVPKEVKEPIAKLLSDKSIQLLDNKSAVVAELWFRKELPASANEAQIKNGLTYRELDETTLLGAVRFAQDVTDYRKQKIKAGVYTLRLAIQPMDGDHMGTAPYNEFCLLCPADMDKTPEVIDAKELHKLSTKSTTRKHPGIMLLFPNKKPAETPVVEAKPKEHWVLSFQMPVSAGEQKASLGFSLVVIGVTLAE